MNRKYLIAIIVAAIVVVALVIAIPSLGGDGGNTAVTVAGDGASAPAISPDATLPSDHPSVDGSGVDAASLEEIVKAAEDAYDADPKDVDAILALAEAYLQSQKPEDATRLFEEAIAVDPGNIPAKTSLAMLAFEQGDVTGAQAQLEAIVAEAPEDQVALYDLGIIYFSTDQRDKAKDTWAQVAAIDPTTEFGQLAQQFIDMMDQSGSSGASPHGATTTTTQ